jgi:sugar lactone lactonase YvrE
VATLPTGTDETASFPNGLAVHGSDLYVSDTVNGAIWRIDLRRDSAVTLTRPWVRSSLLAPSVTWEGVNGIAFQGDTLVAVVSDVGRVVRIPIVRHGAAGSVSVVTRSAALVGADGVAFDTAGRLWVVVNHAQGKASGMLAWVGHNGAVQVVAKDPTWLDYPTQVAFAPQNRYGAGHLRTAGVSDRAPEGSTLYITNGAFTTDGVSDVTAVHVGAVGARLP